MKRSVILFAILMLIGISTNVKSQLTGTKTIPGNYPTIDSAIKALNIEGVGAGGVTFNVAAGHTETSSNMLLTDNDANTVVFQKSGAGANPLITAVPGTSATLDGIIKFSGTDNITFDGIDLLDPPSNTGDARMEWGYALMRASPTNGCQNVVIKNCAITLQKISTISFGIYIVNRDTNGVVITATDPAGQNSFNRFWGNSISDVYKGIVAVASSLTRDVDNEIGVTGLAANTITNWGGSTVSAEGVRCEGQINVKINNNVINGGAGTSGSAATVGIIATLFGAGALVPNYEISYNTVTITASSSSQAHYGIRALATADTIRMHHNIVENCVSAQTSNGFFAMVHDPTGTSNAAYIHDNIVRNNSHSGTGASTLLGGTGGINLSHVYSNQIYGNQKTGASGTMYCIRAANGRTDCESNIIYNNSIPNSSGTALSALYGYRNDDLDPATENVLDNSIYNLSIGGSGTSTTNIVCGIRSSSDALSTKDFSGNSIYGLSTVSGNVTGNTTGGGAVGIWNSTGVTTEIHRNKIFDLTNTGSNGTSVGCWISGGTNTQLHNNVISDLNAPNSGNANGIIGMNISSTTVNSVVDASDASIYLTATGGSTFGSSGVSVTASATATTAALTMRHNNIINLSTPGSTSGNTVAYRRSTAALGNYGLNSDSNNFYAGVPSANRLIFFDGANSDQTLAAYKLRVAPRDANSTSLASKSLTLTINLEACAETDTIEVELRKSLPPYNVLETSKGLGGQGIPHVFNFEQPVDGVRYYIVVNHRNSIQTWSKPGGEEIIDNDDYNFITAASQAFGNNQVLVGSGYSFYTGDVNQDGTVDLSDLVACFNDARDFVTGYVVTDLNCDDVVTLADLLFAYNNASQFVEVKRP